VTPIDTLADTGLVLCDGPRWHDGALWFSDLYGGSIYRVTLDGAMTTVMDVAGGPSGLAFAADGSLLIVSQRDQRILRRSPAGDVDLHADLAGVCRSDANDIVLASDGTAYVTCFGYDLAAGAAPEPALVMRVDKDGSVTAVADGLRFPNALLLDPEERTLLVAETEGHTVLAYRREPDGELSGRRVWADLGDLRPDGMCLDAEGAVWAAGIDACAAVRVAEGGRVLDRVETGGRWTIACMLGGPERRHLFLLTAEATPEQIARGEFRGRVEVTEVAVPGAGLP
jgi:sugar lactone lactonase YvrE